MFDMNFNAEKGLKDLEKEVELTEEQIGEFFKIISGLNLQQ